MDIFVIGTSVCDILAKPVSAKIFESDSTPVETLLTGGGDGMNVAINAAQLGMRTGLATTVGNDENGRFILNRLSEYGVDISASRVSDRFRTGTSIVLIAPDGERHFLLDTAIFQDILPEQITEKMLEGVKILSLNSLYKVAALDDGGIIPVFRRAREMGIITAADCEENLKGNWLSRIEGTLYCTDVFLPSYDEAKMITGQEDVRAMAEVMRPYGMKIFGVKMGPRGSYVTDFEDEYFVDPFPVENIVSTVGAGDAYFAGFLTALAKGMNLRECAVFAGAVASFPLGTMGAEADIPSAEQVEELIKKTLGTY